MAFIPTTNGHKVGDTVILKREHSSLAGTFEKGTEVKVIGKSERGYDIADEYGNRMTECGWNL